MRTSAAALTFLLVAACDSGSDPAPAPPVFGGFEPVDQGAIVFAPTTCDLPGLGAASISGVAVLFTDYVGVCDVLSRVPHCGTRESSATVIGVAVSGVPGTGGVGAVGPGTYTVLDRAPTGAFLAATGDAGKVGPECAAVEGGAGLDVSAGQVVLASVGESITGSINLRFDDGTGFERAVDAAVCPVTFDLCELFQPCWDGYACDLVAP